LQRDGISEISDAEFNPVAEKGPGPGGIAHEEAQTISLRQQLANNFRPDIPGCARNQQLHFAIPSKTTAHNVSKLSH
jgi:hypothetical protein